MLTKDSLYAIVLDNGWMMVIPGAVLSEINWRPNYFFISCILIKNSQKMAYIMKTLYIEWIFEQIAKTAKQRHFLFRSHKPI